MMRRRFLWGIVFVAMCIITVRPADTGDLSYDIEEIPTLGGTQNFALAINDRGNVVGLSWLAGDQSSAGFLFTSGAPTSLSPLNSGAFQTFGPTDINNQGQIASGVISNGLYTAAVYTYRTGQIATLGSLGGVCCGMFTSVATAVSAGGAAVGYSYVDNVSRHAFLYKNGVMTDLGSFGGWSVAFDINANGDVVGAASEHVNGNGHAFLYRDGMMTEIDPFGGPNNESYANGINNDGQVVGTGLVPAGNAFNGFIYSNGAIRNIGTLAGGRNSEAFSINNRGQVIGIADKPYNSLCTDPVSGYQVHCVQYAQKAFLYQNHVMIALNSLIPPGSGWDLDWAFDINNRGQIVGYGVRGGLYRAYVMTPRH